MVNVLSANHTLLQLQSLEFFVLLSHFGPLTCWKNAKITWKITSYAMMSWVSTFRCLLGDAITRWSVEYTRVTYLAHDGNKTPWVYPSNWDKPWIMSKYPARLTISVTPWYSDLSQAATLRCRIKFDLLRDMWFLNTALTSSGVQVQTSLFYITNLLSVVISFVSGQ